MTHFLYYTKFSTKIECFSKKEADAHFKPLIKRLNAFATAFGFRIEIDSATSPSEMPGFTVYHLTVAVEVVLQPGLVLDVAAACQTFADLYGIEMGKESYNTVPDETYADYE